MIKVAIVLILISLSGFKAMTQDVSVTNTINWNDTESITNVENANAYLYTGFISSPTTITSPIANLVNVSYIQPTSQEIELLKKMVIDTTITINAKVVYNRKKPEIQYTFLPYRWNTQTSQFEKVKGYELVFKSGLAEQKMAITHAYANNSLLNSGNWYKIKVDTSGIFKLTYAQIKQLGIANPEIVRIYTHGGRQLPYANSDPNLDDMVEIPIKVVSGTDGVFNDGDYILFYAEGTTLWDYNASLDMFIHTRHNYSKYTYLFLSDSQGAGGKRIVEEDNTQLSINTLSNSFDSYKCYELDKYNLIGSGRTWYGEKFRPTSVLNLNFGFPNIIQTQEAKIFTQVAGRKQQLSQDCYFTVENNNIELGNINITANYTQYTHANEYQALFKVAAPTNSFNITFTFQGESSDMEGYLDYLCINARETLKIYGSQFPFRDKFTVGSGQIAEFQIDNNNKAISVWNITSPLNPFEVKVVKIGNLTTFKAKTDILEQYLAFDGINFFTPILQGDDLGLIANQNLHGASSHDLIIVTHPDFREQADELAQFHRDVDNLTVLVTEPEIIYNEFSSGTPDVTAIRNFMRMLYDNSDSETNLKYLLLFGDGSYDNWTIGAPNNNFIPTYQSLEALSATSSYVSDDYFGLLDADEGEISTGSEKSIYGKLDIGIGRFPVQTTVEAELMLEKTRQYYSAESHGDWKTKVCLIGDDEDWKMHENQAEKISTEIIKPNNPEYNVAKIYLDSFKQYSTPSGQRYPDVTTAINQQVEQGALIMDYVGHGNPRILAHEEILSVSDVQSWRNWNKLSIFVTASCEVGRYDDYERSSFGEWILLNPQGGGIAAFTTTRIVYAGANDQLNRSFFRNVFDKDQRLGDIIRNAKNAQGASEINHRNFTLLGNPAIKVAVPESKIVIGSINRNFLSLTNPTISFSGEKTAIVYEPGDTINALSKARVEGYIDDKNGNPVKDNGILYITVYDKTDTLVVEVNDATTDPNKLLEFTLQDKILYKGKASITEGYFDFEFIVPKDINYKYGNGKISLYAVLDSSEAVGYSENIIIGGSAENIAGDITGPVIELYINDTTFKNGGLTDENPVLLAKLYDDSGINTTGIGFGHNITAILDGNQDKVYILNNYYEGYLDQYNSGEVRFPLTGLTSGYHTLTFKAFDIYNISAEATIEFNVIQSSEVAIENLQNNPNPFYDETRFVFDHNQGWNDFETKIEIFDMLGNKINVLYQKNTSQTYTIEPIIFYGTNAAGAKLPKGVYPYKVEITNADGQKAYESSKLVIFK